MCISISIFTFCEPPNQTRPARGSGGCSEILQPTFMLWFPPTPKFKSTQTTPVRIHHYPCLPFARVNEAAWDVQAQSRVARWPIPRVPDSAQSSIPPSEPCRKRQVHASAERIKIRLDCIRAFGVQLDSSHFPIIVSTIFVRPAISSSTVDPEKSTLHPTCTGIRIRRARIRATRVA